jgi:zinc protease
VFAVLRALQVEEIDEDYVQKVREKRLREHEEGLRQNGYWMSSILFRDRYGIDQREMNETEELIRSLESSDVQTAARSYIDFDRYVRVSLMPADAGR